MKDVLKGVGVISFVAFGVVFGCNLGRQLAITTHDVISIPFMRLLRNENRRDYKKGLVFDRGLKIEGILKDDSII